MIIIALDIHIYLKKLPFGYFLKKRQKLLKLIELGMHMNFPNNLKHPKHLFESVYIPPNVCNLTDRAELLAQTS